MRGPVRGLSSPRGGEGEVLEDHLRVSLPLAWFLRESDCPSKRKLQAIS